MFQRQAKKPRVSLRNASEKQVKNSCFLAVFLSFRREEVRENKNGVDFRVFQQKLLLREYYNRFHSNVWYMFTPLSSFDATDT